MLREPHEREFTYLLSARIHVRGEKFDDEAIAQLAGVQHGIVARRQLLDLCVGDRAVACRLERGRLRPIHPGVYAVGHEALTYSARALAAVMAVAPVPRPVSVTGGDWARRSPVAAVASHTTAATILGFGEPADGPIHVSIDEKRVRRPGIAIHRAVLPADDVTIVDGIPVTTTARALLDLSATTPFGRLRRLVKRAEYLELTDLAALEAILHRYPRRRGRRTLAAIVDRYAGAGKTRSELEDRFLEFCARRGLPPPKTNVALEVRGQRFEVDCAWPQARLVVELDGRTAHGRESSFHDDRARDRALLADGWRPMRVTWPQLHLDGDSLELEIREVLAAPPARSGGFGVG
jgi:predicted transcriptional regulator of viral defense system